MIKGLTVNNYKVIFDWFFNCLLRIEAFEQDIQKKVSVLLTSIDESSLKAPANVPRWTTWQQKHSDVRLTSEEATSQSRRMPHQTWRQCMSTNLRLDSS